MLILAEYGVDLILRNRRVSKTEAKHHPGAPFHQYSRYCPLVEVCRPDTPLNAILCTEEEGFYILTPDKGAIFVSEVPPKGSVQSDFFTGFLDWYYTCRIQD